MKHIKRIFLLFLVIASSGAARFQSIKSVIYKDSSFDLIGTSVITAFQAGNELFNPSPKISRKLVVSSQTFKRIGAANLPKPDWERYTQKGNTIYAHWMNPNLGLLNTKGINGDLVKNIYLLKSGG